MLVGFDFDNTLISYDKLFRLIALERELIPEDIRPQKNAVRNYLRLQGNENAWTLLQGEVYGGRIQDAEPYPGMLGALIELTHRGVPMCIVSHKTRTPYLGEPLDLHSAARSWLDKYVFHLATC
jgi:FMN phosphatase YigB (HAD superfamily)